ncbi:nucleoside diphosphate kinase regulator [Methylobacterium nodulans]|uniref:GreA/GreB family elongation factor n=1 Tax=Methylobacterium nodulans (strain LMG 21967 / CNCM I-2342 / ORS 2060) TaxID=460265 RepID=B8IFL5_METNO|nr:nucleoside diphosphate kinase regulator [Methylobacterium nodulans]ACL57750.1 GreA/GreB family elongation factor [Methylobacterium nodulans ORS 2060]
MTIAVKKTPDGTGKPRIKMTVEDHERLSALAAAAQDRMPDVASCLADELDRAQIVAGRGRLPPFVRMGCQVEFRDDTTGRVQIVTLVYPGEANIEQGKISVLTPIGAALIGLSTGQSITWETRSGLTKSLTVLDVRESVIA